MADTQGQGRTTHFTRTRCPSAASKHDAMKVRWKEPFEYSKEKSLRQRITEGRRDSTTFHGQNQVFPSLKEHGNWRPRSLHVGKINCRLISTHSLFPLPGCSSPDLLYSPIIFLLLPSGVCPHVIFRKTPPPPPLLPTLLPRLNIPITSCNHSAYYLSFNQHVSSVSMRFPLQL